MPIRPLAEIAISHGFFRSGRFDDARILPDAATARRLKGLRIVEKARAGGLTLYLDIAADGTTLVPLPDSVPLAFSLAPLPPAIAAATDMEALGAAPHFTDEGIAAGEPLRRAPRSAGLSGFLTLALTIGRGTVAAAAAGQPKQAVVPLPARAARWCYHLVTDADAPLADWRIEAGNGAPAFADSGRAELDAASAGDPFGQALWQRSRPHRVLRFLSTDAVPASEQVQSRISLHAGTARLMGPLPNPDAGALRLVAGAPSFGAVLRHLTS